jgi:hypothetical protein
LLSELFTEGFAHALDSPASSAALELAIWEILDENGSPNDLRGGSFHVLSDNGNTAPVSAANYPLTQLPSTGSYTITLLHSAENQDFVFGTDLTRDAPEPSPRPLAGIRFIAMIVVTLRRPGWQRRACLARAQRRRTPLAGRFYWTAGAAAGTHRRRRCRSVICRAG